MSTQKKRSTFKSSKTTAATPRPAAPVASKPVQNTERKAIAVKPPVKAKKSSQNIVDYDAVASRAFEIWQREGCPEGKDCEHWVQAEKELVPQAV